MGFIVGFVAGIICTFLWPYIGWQGWVITGLLTFVGTLMVGLSRMFRW